METTLREWLIADQAFPHGYAWLPRPAAVGRAVGCSVPRGQPAAQDVRVAESSRTVVACLEVLTRRLDAIGNGATPALSRAEVCDA